MGNVWSDIAYPWGPTLTSFAELKEDSEVLWTSIVNIILTRKGERVMLPEFGSLVPDTVFEPNDDVLVAGLRADVQDAIQKWDDRIEFLDLEVERSENNLTVRISFKNLQDPMEAAIHVAEFELVPSSL